MSERLRTGTSAVAWGDRGGATPYRYPLDKNRIVTKMKVNCFSVFIVLPIDRK
jgi:hypothetical protein